MPSWGVSDFATPCRPPLLLPGDSSEDRLFSSEEALDSDRPDYYQKPLEPTPNDDFTNSGLPDWMDPIYDEVNCLLPPCPPYSFISHNVLIKWVF